MRTTTGDNMSNFADNKKVLELFNLINGAVVSGWLSGISHLSETVRKQPLSEEELKGFSKLGAQVALMYRGQFLVSEAGQRVINLLCDTDPDKLKAIAKELEGEASAKAAAGNDTTVSATTTITQEKHENTCTACEGCKTKCDKS